MLKYVLMSAYKNAFSFFSPNKVSLKSASFWGKKNHKYSFSSRTNVHLYIFFFLQKITSYKKLAWNISVPKMNVSEMLSMQFRECEWNLLLLSS